VVEADTVAIRCEDEKEVEQELVSAECGKKPIAEETMRYKGEAVTGDSP
jgi:hypothetical protein